MKPTRLGIVGGALLVSLLAGNACFAASLDDLTLGDHWMGEQWDREALKERTVVVEMWGYN